MRQIAHNIYLRMQSRQTVITWIRAFIVESKSALSSLEIVLKVFWFKMQLSRIMFIFPMLLIAEASYVQITLRNHGDDYDLGVLVEYESKEDNPNEYQNNSCWLKRDTLFRETAWIVKSSSYYEIAPRGSSPVKIEVWIRPLNSGRAAFLFFKELHQKPTNSCVEFKGNSNYPTHKNIDCPWQRENKALKSKQY